MFSTSNTDKYFGVSALNSGFFMFDNKLGDNTRIIWGLRAEFFEQFLSSRDLSLKRVIVNTEKWDFLPSINLTYSFNPRNQLRVSASRTVARPEFREIAPFQFFDYEQIWGISGETELKRTSILNGDLRYEFYPKPGELVSFGLLAKRFIRVLCLLIQVQTVGINIRSQEGLVIGNTDISGTGSCAVSEYPCPEITKSKQSTST